VKEDRNNNFALVTGASSGIGYEYARQLAQKGYPLIIVSNEEKIADCATEISGQYGVTVHGLVRNLGTPDAARELYDYCHEQGWDVEVLVNNAGVYHDKDILDDSEAFTQLIIQLHMTTPAMLCYLFGQDMTARGKGYILNMCSITANIAGQRLGTYGSTKAFLANFTRALHIELKQKGVRVTAVYPGAVDTGLYHIPAWVMKGGRALGIVVSPQYLAKRGLRAMFYGRWKITVPFVYSKLLLILIALAPTCLLRLIRRLGWF